MFDIVSAVIINRNRPEDLKECIESIQRQTYTTNEIVVVDNNSEKPPAWATIHLPRNMGVTLPTNIGVASSMGKYILLIDNDVILDEHFVERAIEVFNLCPGVGIVAGRVFYHGTTEDIEYKSYASDDPPDVPQFIGIFYGAACMIRRECWDQVGGFNERYFAYHHEIDFSAKAIDKGWWIYYRPSCIAWHKISYVARDRSAMLYYLTRNCILFAWQHLPLHLALFQTAKAVGRSLYYGFRHPYTLFRAYLGVVGYIPFSIRDRKPVNDWLFLRPWKKLFRGPL